MPDGEGEGAGGGGWEWGGRGAPINGGTVDRWHGRQGVAAGAGAAAVTGQKDGAAAVLSRGNDAQAGRGDPGGSRGDTQVEAARGADDAEGEDGFGGGIMNGSST